MVRRARSEAQPDTRQWFQHSSAWDADARFRARRSVTYVMMEEGIDIQGIPWDRIPRARTEYREHRQAIYNPYRNVEYEQQVVDAEVTEVERNGTMMYTPFEYHADPDVQFKHFQLRHNLHCVDEHQLVYMSANTVSQFCCLDHDITTVMPIHSGGGPGPAGGPLETNMTSTVEAKSGVTAIGHFDGVMKVKVEFEDGTSTDHTVDAVSSEQNIVNRIAIDKWHSGSAVMVAACNDMRVHVIDLATLTLAGSVEFDVAVNGAKLSPDQSMMAVIGDTTLATLVDPRSMSKVENLSGHFDFSFGLDWSPCSRYIATGNQDLTTRVFDIRQPKSSLYTLRSSSAAVRCLTFASTSTLILAEAFDTISVYDIAKSRPTQQVVEVFGEIGGMCTSPENDRLYVGVSDQHFGGVLELLRADKIAAMFESLAS
uniref:Uncharacterized protein n=1 Tax=Palpitomonas bilix TaxID=652834 RepID=A0A7S3G0X7_9EUKA|mmetsp:Transcript_19818/g.50681  ORF Transcript_19818/g.50681 Transcript_19818/m.50681 type:complete len:427 (+) Transcript_19818:222-1502(+)